MAEAEVIEEDSGTKIKTRVSELSVNGCYLDMANPLPQGTAVVVKIFTETDFFEALGSAVYSHPNLGIGVTFREVKPFYAAILQKWLLVAMKNKPL